MIHKFLSFTLTLIFLILVGLFFYKQNRTSEVLTAKVTDDSVKASNFITKEQVDNLIKDYIINNPEAIIESLEGLHNKKVNESTQKAVDFLKENKTEIEQVDLPPVFGNPDGDITIVVFYDYNCSFCKKASEYENEIIKADNGIKIVLRPIPIINDNSMYVTKVALAAQKILGTSFYGFHNDLMNIQNIDQAQVKTLVAKYNISEEVIENEINSYGIKQIINKNFELARGIGITGTPSYVINGSFVAGMITTDKFKNIIMQIRAKK